MPTTSRIRRLALLLVLPVLLFVAACDRHDHDDDHFGVVERVEVRDRATNTLYGVWQRAQTDLGFQGDGVPHLHVGEEIALNVLFFDIDGQQVALSRTGEFRLGVRLAEAARDGVAGTPGVVDFSAHGDHADIEGAAEGETYLVFQLMHGNHSDFDTPPIEIEVDDHD